MVYRRYNYRKRTNRKPAITVIKRTRKYKPFSRRYIRKYRPLPFNGFGKSARCMHRYSEYTNIDPNVGSVGLHVIRANSIFDPSFTLAGHQPMGRDEYANIYTQYTVVGAKIKATLYSYGSSNLPIAWGVMLDDDATAAVNVQAIIESGRGKHRVISNNYLSDGNTKTLTCYYSPRKFFHIKDIKDNQLSLGAAVGSNPTRDAYFIVWVGPLDGSSDLNGTAIDITVDYIVDWSEKVTMSQS